MQIEKEEVRGRREDEKETEEKGGRKSERDENCKKNDMNRSGRRVGKLKRHPR